MEKGSNQLTQQEMVSSAINLLGPHCCQCIHATIYELQFNCIRRSARNQKGSNAAPMYPMYVTSGGKKECQNFLSSGCPAGFLLLPFQLLDSVSPFAKPATEISKSQTRKILNGSQRSSQGKSLKEAPPPPGRGGGGGGEALGRRPREGSCKELLSCKHSLDLPLPPPTTTHAMGGCRLGGETPPSSLLIGHQTLQG